jgi:hypothetical protein
MLARRPIALLCSFAPPLCAPMGAHERQNAVNLYSEFGFAIGLANDATTMQSRAAVYVECSGGEACLLAPCRGRGRRVLFVVYLSPSVGMMSARPISGASAANKSVVN